MTGDSGKGPSSQSSDNALQQPATEACQDQSPPAEAIKVPDKKSDKDAAEAMLEYGRSLNTARNAEKENNLVQARSIYERLIGAQPERYEAYHRLAVVADRQRRYEEAQSLYTQAIHLSRRNPELFNDLGYCFYLQGNLGKAESALLKAVAMSPAQPALSKQPGIGVRPAAALRRGLGAVSAGRWGGRRLLQPGLRQGIATRFCRGEGLLPPALAADPTHERARRALASFETAESQPDGVAKMSELAEEETNWVPYVEKESGSADSGKAGTAEAGTAEASAGSGRAGTIPHSASATQGLIDRAEARATMNNQTTSR